MRDRAEVVGGMNLTIKLRHKIVEMFKGGASIADIAHWYEKDGATIENVLREGLLTKDVVKEAVVQEATADLLERANEHAEKNPTQTN